MVGNTIEEVEVVVVVVVDETIPCWCWIKLSNSWGEFEGWGDAARWLDEPENDEDIV